MYKPTCLMKAHASINDNIRWTMIGVLCVCFPLIVFSANKVKSIKSFSVNVPDTVVQGSNFYVEYELEATHWKNAHITQGVGLALTELLPYTLENYPYQKLNVKARFFTSRVGRIKLPPMSAEIDGSEVLSEAKEVFVKPHPQYGDEMTVAHEWLIRKGVDKDSLFLNYTSSVGDFFIFSDQQHECYCLVAKKDTWNYAGDPVWAYSLECAMNEKALKDFTPYFYKYYSELLDSMKKSGQKVQQTTNDKDAVVPLLRELRWGQNAPYNSKLPNKDKKRVLVGCVPLAMTMIMKYHEWPKQGTSMVNFEVENRKFQFNCTELKPQWEQYKNRYEEKEVEECGDLSKVLGTLGLIMSPKYQESETAANMSHLKHIMCNNLGYSGKLTLKVEPTNKEVHELLKREIKNHRPCIVSTNSHAFVCDGYDDDFFHYNMGWQGFGNGYYRIGSNLGWKGKQLFDVIITQIIPQRKEQEKEVTLKQAGTLAEVLSEEEKESLTSLTISGPINSSDIRLIRAMSGARGDSIYDNRDMGNLRKLDLTNATITADNMPYRRRKATSSYSGYKYYMHDDGTTGGMHSTFKDYKFDFTQMNEKEWKQFKSNFGKMIKKKGMSYTRINDTEYIETSFCIKNTIGEQMFADCTSLSDIKLPQKLSIISDHAFYNCMSLQYVHIPPKTELGKDIFFECPAFLETTYYK